MYNSLIFYFPLSAITDSVTANTTTNDKGGFFVTVNYFWLNIRFKVENFAWLYYEGEAKVLCGSTCGS